MRRRAILLEDKLERYRAILDAAERLLLRSPARPANMEEVADEAGLAKGTVYLYFPSKEGLLLALHERNIDGLFQALTTLLDGEATVTIADVAAVMHERMVNPPLFLPLASRCVALMDRRFARRLSKRLERAGASLQRHFDALTREQAVALLSNSYALVIGLWQIAGSESGQQLKRAMIALWEGTLPADAARGLAESAGDPDRLAGDAPIRGRAQEYDRIGDVAARR